MEGSLLSQGYNVSNQTTGGQIIHQNPPIDDLDEFAELKKKWEKISRLVKVLYDCNCAIAIVMALISILVLCTIFSKNVRSRSPMWFTYHMMVLGIFALVLHLVVYTGGITGTQTCRFVFYSAEYVLFMLSLNILLVDVEIYLVYILPISLWKHNTLTRFIVTMLVAWILVCLLVTHITIDNNDSKYFCLHISDEGIEMARNVLQEYLPAILCLIATIVVVVTFFLRTSRNRFVEAAGGLREVISLDTENMLPWVLMSVGLNVLFMARACLLLVIRYGIYLQRFDLDNQVGLVLLYIFRNFMFYAFPLPVLFLPEVRLVIKEAVVTFVAVVKTKANVSQDTSNLRVTMETVGNETA